MTKTIGILGGMGSYATHHFFGKLLEYSEPDEFRIIIDNNVDIPSRTLAVRESWEKIDIVSAHMRECLSNLCSHGANMAVVPCNSAHYWHDLCEPVPHAPFWLNMIEVVSNAVKAKGYERPLILGGYVTVEKKLYSEYLPGAVYLDDEENGLIYEAIAHIKKSLYADGDLACEIAEALWNIKEAKKCDCFLYACTELSLNGLYGPDDFPVIDSASEYAKATVEYARGK